MTVYSQLLGETDRRRKTRSCKRSQASIVTPTGVLSQLITEAQYRTNEFVKDAYDI
ncbi:15105_t:CDS:2 [Entrophospora sp. SA101]|nr:15105_t:CDS:2 [Entrophospora sp. SA101]CAJ0855598.1 9006_t:CDS:2 [Entrophospora sp. SA101]